MLYKFKEDVLLRNGSTFNAPFQITPQGQIIIRYENRDVNITDFVHALGIYDKIFNLIEEVE